MSELLAVRTIGRFAVCEAGVWRDRRRVNDRALRLLELLALAEGESVSSSDLCQALWPQEAGAAAKLRKTVQRLRQRFGPVIVSSRGGYALNVDACALDASELERQIADLVAAKIRGELVQERAGRLARVILDGDVAAIDATSAGAGFRERLRLRAAMLAELCDEPAAGDLRTIARRLQQRNAVTRPADAG